MTLFGFMQRQPTLAEKIVATVMLLGMIALALFIVRPYKVVVDAGGLAQGTVISRSNTYERGSRIWVDGQIRFAGSDGRTHDIPFSEIVTFSNCSNIGLPGAAPNPECWEVGATVAVRYDPANPQGAKTAETAEGQASMGEIAFIMLLAVLAIIWWPRRTPAVS